MPPNMTIFSYDCLEAYGGGGSERASFKEEELWKSLATDVNNQRR
jgi:hypothetical protein